MARSSPSGTDSDTDEPSRYTFSRGTPFVNPFKVVLNKPEVINIYGTEFISYTVNNTKVYVQRHGPAEPFPQSRKTRKASKRRHTTKNKTMRKR